MLLRPIELNLVLVSFSFTGASACTLCELGFYYGSKGLYLKYSISRMLTLLLFTHFFRHFASNSCHRACYIHISWLCKAFFAIQTKFVTGATTVEACLMCQAGHFSTAAGHHLIIWWSEYCTLTLR